MSNAQVYLSTGLPVRSEIRAKPARTAKPRTISKRAAKAMLDAPADGFDGAVRDDVGNALDGIDENTLNDALRRALRENNVEELRRRLRGVAAWAGCALDTLDRAAAHTEGD